MADEQLLKYYKKALDDIEIICTELLKQLKCKKLECENWKETANQYAKNEEYYKSQVDKYEAENEKVEQEREALQMSDNEAKEIIAELKAECDESKEEIGDLKEIIQRHDNDNNALLSEFEDDLVDYYRRHKECLIEIKEIAENMNNECFYSDFDCKYCDMKNGCTYHEKIKILQKISEVLNDR